MAYRGFRKIQGSGDALLIHLVDTSADLPSVARCRVGDTAWCIAAGGEDGRQWVVKKSSAGLEWAAAGAGSTLSLVDLTVTNNARLAKLYLSAGSMEFYADDVAGTLGCGVLTAPRTWTFADRSGTVLTHAAGVIAGLPLESELDFASPAGDGTFTIKNSISTNKGHLKLTGGLGMLGAAPMNVAVAVTDPVGGSVIDVEARAAIAQILVALRPTNGLGAVAA